MSATRVDFHGAVTGKQEPWVHFAALSGDEGLHWADEYRRIEHREFALFLNQSLDLLRRRQMASGQECLARAHQRLTEIDVSRPVYLALERCYLSARAYYEYCVEELDQADRSLELALESIQQAIELRSFLVPLAQHAYDFRVQRARIARNRRRWEQMWHHLETGRAMVADQLPLCILANGERIYLSSVFAFFGSIPVDPDEKAALAELMDHQEISRQYDLFAYATAVLPGFVIPYA